MSESWFVEPESVRIDLPGGQWILVKKELTVDERSRAYAVVKAVNPDRTYTIDSEAVGKAEVVAYLLDWSLCDKGGKPVRIQNEDAKRSAVGALRPVQFKIISDAIEQHVKSMEALRVEEKNGDGESASPAISPSVS